VTAREFVAATGSAALVVGVDVMPADPEVGLQHNIGIGRNASGAVSCVNILERA